MKIVVLQLDFVEPLIGKSGGSAAKVSRRLVELAEIKPGSKVLDIASGIGEPAITAAKQVGRSGGHVLAIDISPQMLSIAKQKAKSLGLQDVIEFKEGDAETIDLASQTKITLRNFS
jgi:ubiquinone/menaquinone biosynthesis C-methylase UbiE